MFLVLFLAYAATLGVYVVFADRTVPTGGRWRHLRYHLRDQAGELVLADRVKDLSAQLKSHLTAARDIAAKAEGDSNRDFTADERSQVTELLAKASEVRKQLDQASGDKGLLDAIGDLGDGIGLDTTEKIPPAAFQTRQRRKTLGGQFTESPEFKAFLGGFPGGRIPEKTRIQCTPVGFKTLITGTDDTSAGAFVVTERSDIVEGLGRRPLTIRDVISVRQTGSDLIEFVRQTSRVNAAAPVEEASVTDDGSGVKPEGGFEYEIVPTPVKTIAEWVPATRRALSDVTQLRALIDQELEDDVAEEEEDQIIAGDGTGENLAGILETSGIQSQAFATDLLTTTRKARTKVRTVGRAVPNAYLFNPADWETIDLLTDNEARYYFGGPMVMGSPRLWGLPVIESEAVPAGTGLVGDFRKAVLWDREQASITVSDSHADFFIRNMIVVLGEERVAFALTRPSAVVEIDLTA